VLRAGSWAVRPVHRCFHKIRPIVQEYNKRATESRGVRAAAAGTFRIVAVGDSFTYGYGVPEEDTFVRGIERDLQKRCPSGTSRS